MTCQKESTSSRVGSLSKILGVGQVESIGQQEIRADRQRRVRRRTGIGQQGVRSDRQKDN